MELADNTNINLSMSRQCYHKRRKTDKTRLANFLSDHELLVDSTHPEAYLNILKQKRDKINEKWLDNYYTDPTTKVFAGGNEKTPEHHWRCEMAKLNQMIVESERTLAETEDVPELIPEQAVELAAQEEQPRQPTASDDANALMATMLAMLTRMEALLAAINNNDANALMLAKMSADIEALKIQIAAVNTPAATGSAAVAAAAAAASNSGNIDNTDDDDDFYDEFGRYLGREHADSSDDDDDDSDSDAKLANISNPKRRKKKRKRNKENGVTGGGGANDDETTTTGASVVGGDGSDTYADVDVDDNAAAAANLATVAAAISAKPTSFRIKIKEQNKKITIRMLQIDDENEIGSEENDSDDDNDNDNDDSAVQELN